MEKNIAALLRSDATSICVRFQGSEALYTYITHLPVSEGNLVVVAASGQVKVAQVIAVDQQLQIEPQSDIKFSWVMDVVDTKAYEDNIKKNIEIEETVSKAYRNNLRRSFADQLLASVDDASRESLQKLLG